MSPWVQKPDGSTVVVGPQSANHHWWPRGISKFWKGNDGNVGCVRKDDDNFKTFRTQHQNLGGKRNGHSQLYTENRHGSPWNRSEEHVFDSVDDNMGMLVGILEKIALQAVTPTQTEWYPAPNDPALRDALAPALLSLCLRNPHSRFLASSMGRNMMGFKRGSRMDKNVSLANILASFHANEKHLRGQGRFGIFVARESEFIYGDGCFHNIHPSGDIFNEISMLVPMTPTIAVGYRLPSQYMTEPMFCVMNVGAEIVTTFNHLIQTYSETELFFSNIEPKILPEFKRGEFLHTPPQHNRALYWLNQLPGL